MKDSPQRLDGAKAATQAEGGPTIFFYMLMGRYDLAMLNEFPDDNAAARFALEVGALGNARTETLKAFTEDEYRAIVGSF